MAAPIYSCKYCDKKYRHSQSRTHHVRKCHKVGPAKPFFCREERCRASFSTSQLLRSHLANIHSLPVVDETEEFASMDDFQRWKEDLERTEHAKFFLGSAMKGKKDCTAGYYYCNRNGSYTSRSTGKRRTRESCRTGEFCTAYIAIKVHTESGKVSVKYCTMHYKHDKELRHLHLSSSEKAWVAAQCAQKVSREEILTKVRESSQDSPERIHLITRKDIANIQRAYDLQGIERHRDDKTSLMMYIEELNELGNHSPILHCKGEKQENLLGNDFLLIIQSPFQQQMLQEFGSNIICLDTTRGTNGCDFKLTSVLVVDEFGEGFPAGWCISSRQDLVALKQFFQVLFKKCGPVKPKWIMTDDAEQYYSAWVDVFGGDPRKLLCTWHVDRAWKGKLKLIKDQQVQGDVYKVLRVLLEEPSEEHFGDLVKTVKEDLEDDARTEAFGDYLTKTYLSRPEQWAYCYRKQAGLSTNTYCEAFQDVLKNVNIQGKSNKRLDRCVFLLISWIKDKAFDRLIKLDNGKPTSKMAIITAHHRCSENLSVESVEQKGNNSFRVASECRGNEHYLVAFTTAPCKQSCKISCSECKVCVHTSFCTCTDSLIHGVICKHVHLVCRYRNETVWEVDMQEPQPDVSVSPVISAVQSLRPNTRPNQELHQLLATLTSLLNRPNTSSAVLSEVKTCLITAFNLLKMSENH